MIGLDVKVVRFDLLLKHLRIDSLFFKFGHIQQFCLKVNSTAKEQQHPSAVFLVLNEPDTAKILENISSVDVVAVSEGKKVVGRGCSNASLTIPTDACPVDSTDGNTPGFHLLKISEIEVPIEHLIDDKPSLELGRLFVRVSIFDLKARKPCLCISSSAATSNNVSIDEVSVPCCDTSSEYSEDDGDDSSLDDFLRRLEGRTAAVQTVPEKTSSTTQTAQREEKPFRERVLRVSQSVDRDVLAVLGPRNRRTDNPAFFSAPPRRTVQLQVRPSTARRPEPRRTSPPPVRRQSASQPGAARPRLLYTPKVEPRKTVQHNLPWY